MNHPDPAEPGEWIQQGELPESLLALLGLIGRDAAPVLPGHAARIHELGGRAPGRARGTAARGRLPRNRPARRGLPALHEPIQYVDAPAQLGRPPRALPGGAQRGRACARRHRLRIAAGLGAPPPRRQAPLQATSSSPERPRTRGAPALGSPGRLADDLRHAPFRRNPPRVVHQSGALLARSSTGACSRRRRTRGQPAARAGALPRDRGLEPLGVLRGARRQPAPAGRGGHHQAHAGRPDARRSS